MGSISSKRFAISTLLALSLATTGCHSRSGAVEPAKATNGSRQTVATDQKGAKPRWSKKGAATVATGDIAPGNVITLVSDDPKVNGNYPVEFDGTAKLPYNVKIQTAGLSESQLKESIHRAYARYFKNPESSVDVRLSKKQVLVEAQGLVQKPGQYLVRPGSSLDEIIAAAGGLQQGANQQPNAEYVRVKQGGDTQVVRLRDYYSGTSDINIEWKGGETVFFQSERPAAASATAVGQRNYVHVLGQVREPGEYAFKPDADFYDYLIQAGGPTDRANINNVQLLREEDGTHDARSFDMEDEKTIPVLKAGDTLIVHADVRSDTERKASLWGSFATIVTSVATVVILAIAI